MIGVNLQFTPAGTRTGATEGPSKSNTTAKDLDLCVPKWYVPLFGDVGRVGMEALR